MSRDDHLVRRKCPQRILDREARVGVTDLTGDLHAELPDRLDRAFEPRLRFLTSFVDVAEGVLQTRFHERGGDDLDLGPSAPGAPLDLLHEGASADGLVCDDEHPTDSGFDLWWCLDGLGDHLAARYTPTRRLGSESNARKSL